MGPNDGVFFFFFLHLSLNFKISFYFFLPLFVFSGFENGSFLFFEYFPTHTSSAYTFRLVKVNNIWNKYRYFFFPEGTYVSEPVGFLIRETITHSGRKFGKMTTGTTIGNHLSTSSWKPSRIPTIRTDNTAGDNIFYVPLPTCWRDKTRLAVGMTNMVRVYGYGSNERTSLLFVR